MEGGKQEREKFVKQPPALYATPIDFSAQFLILNLTASMFPGNYILKYVLTDQFFTCIPQIFVKNLLLASWRFAASIQKSKL